MDAVTIPLAGIVLTLTILYLLVGSELAEAYGNRRVPIRELARLPRAAPRRQVAWPPLLMFLAGLPPPSSTRLTCGDGRIGGYDRSPVMSPQSVPSGARPGYRRSERQRKSFARGVASR